MLQRLVVSVILDINMDISIGFWDGHQHKHQHNRQYGVGSKVLREHPNWRTRKRGSGATWRNIR